MAASNIILVPGQRVRARQHKSVEPRLRGLTGVVQAIQKSGTWPVVVKFDRLDGNRNVAASQLEEAA